MNLDYQFEIFYNFHIEKSMFFLTFANCIGNNKNKGIKKMAVGEKITAKEKLIEFIHNLTDEEVKIIISHFNKAEQEQP